MSVEVCGGATTAAAKSVLCLGELCPHSVLAAQDVSKRLIVCGVRELRAQAVTGSRTQLNQLFVGIDPRGEERLSEFLACVISLWIDSFGEAAP